LREASCRRLTDHGLYVACAASGTSAVERLQRRVEHRLHGPNPVRLEALYRLADKGSDQATVLHIGIDQKINQQRIKLPIADHLDEPEQPLAVTD